MADTSSTVEVGDSTDSKTLFVANRYRQGGSIFNDSTAVLFVKWGDGATSTSWSLKMAAGSYSEVPASYTGIVTGVWASDAGGQARCTEFT